MKSKLGNSEDVFLLGINVHVVGGAGKTRCLDESPNRGWIVTLDIAFVCHAKALDLPVMSGELTATAPYVDRVAPDKFFFARIFQILPARRPGNRGIGDVVGSRRLTQKLRQVPVARAAVQVIAQIAAELSAGICDSSGPVARLRVQHDVRRLDAGCGKHNHLGIDFHFLFRGPVDVRNPFCHAIFVNNYTSYQSVCEEREVLGGFGLRDRKPGGRKKRPDIAAAAAVSTVVAARMTVVCNCQLGTAVRKIWDADLFGSLLNDVINAAPRNWR